MAPHCAQHGSSTRSVSCSDTTTADSPSASQALKTLVPEKGSSQAQLTVLSSIKSESGHPSASWNRRMKPWCPTHTTEGKTLVPATEEQVWRSQPICTSISP